MARKLLQAAIVAIMLTASFFTNAHFSHAGGPQAKVGVDSLNVRQGPGLTYSVVAQIHKGETYEIVGQQKDWVQIKVSAFTKGWVASWLVTTTDNGYTASSSDSIGIVTADGLRLRSGPGTGEKVIDVLSKNEKVSILASSSNWYKVNANGHTGWISSEFVSMSGKTEAASTTSAKSAIITATSLNARSNPDLGSRIVGSLKKGDRVRILSTKNDWNEIEFGGDTAWISGKYVEYSDSPAPSSPSSGNQTMMAVVKVDNLNVREEPSLNGNIVGSVKSGERVKLIEEKNDWMKIELSQGSTGWVAGWFMEKTMAAPSKGNDVSSSKGTAVILYNGTNIRKQPSVQSGIALRANAGDSFRIKGVTGDWVEIYLSNGDTAFVAGWIISTDLKNAPGKNGNESPQSHGSIAGKTIVIDPGHGGRDNGTTGNKGTLEKNMTLKTAQLLYDKLSNAGAKVIMTRNDDRYISLQSRVAVAQYEDADAFISIHYDSIPDRSVNGHTTYYYHSFQKDLAESVNQAVSKKVNLRDRGVRFGDYHVIRENHQPSTLLELGYLSNPAEEASILSNQYQQIASTGIYNGLMDYFN
ncbi:SH3 domain-containing protein [Falsibacillus pallidus]|uniref:N-acetylmuramoyl-L-alanine amidase n=1 Tax=Falsibacillus pallidus TaxID=493781 RepID=A0A370GL83_9BACI|nr:SH3 domain-containing protein [Falsibacillus pallidus]RDI44110.1 N-acetylmuramoyl-L-alanine amidase [Falsibacillus pallidus]